MERLKRPSRWESRERDHPVFASSLNIGKRLRSAAEDEMLQRNVRTRRSRWELNPCTVDLSHENASNSFRCNQTSPIEMPFLDEAVVQENSGLVEEYPNAFSGRDSYEDVVVPNADSSVAQTPPELPKEDHRIESNLMRTGDENTSICHSGSKSSEMRTSRSSISESIKECEDHTFATDHSLVAQEYTKLSGFLFTAEIVGISQRSVEKLLRVAPVEAKVTYRSLLSYVKRISLVHKSSIPMCPNEHAARAGSLRKEVACPECSQSFTGPSSRSFWYMKPSDMIAALCRSRDSFGKILDGIKRAKDGLEECEIVSKIQDYFHGRLFRRLHGERVHSWEDENDNKLLVFLTFSTDGFEVAKTRTGDTVSSWPLVSTILNYIPSERSRASNSLIFATIPGSHKSQFFESFLSVIVEDFRNLEKGIEVVCADGRTRLVQAFVYMFTSDWPAASKVLGFVGHTATSFCRFCCKMKTYVRKHKTSVALPQVERKVSKEVAKGRCRLNPGSIIKIECPKPRTNSDISRVWKQLRKISDEPQKRRKIAKSTGISKPSLLRKLHMEFPYSAPYDVMHLVLLGWVKHVLKMITWAHIAVEKLKHAPSFVIPPHVLCLINEGIENCSSSIPSSWGRTPFSLEHLSRFKAEDLKKHADMYLLPFLHRYKVQKNIIRLWEMTSEIVQVCFNYSCGEEVCTDMKGTVEQLYAQFIHVFHSKGKHSFCFTPTTHAILHLPDIMEECGPLPISSQFVVERLLGDMGRRVHSRKDIFSHMFHKSHTLFSMRVANGGSPPVEIGTKLDNLLQSAVVPDKDEYDEHYGVSANGLGAGKTLSSISSDQTSCIRHFVTENLSNWQSVSWSNLKCFEKANVKIGTEFVVLESEGAHRRQKRRVNGSRQKFCISALFHTRTPSPCNTFSSITTEESPKELYYGSVKLIWSCTIQGVEQGKRCKVNALFVDVCWYYGLRFNISRTLVYSEDLRRGEVTSESATCIASLIGFIDIGNRRYFLDRDCRRRRHMTLQGSLIEI